MKWISVHKMEIFTLSGAYDFEILLYIGRDKSKLTEEVS